MRSRLVLRLLQILVLFAGPGAFAENRLSIIVSVPEQRLYVFNPDGDEVTHYPVSTSKYGVGDSCGSYNTPLGKMEVAAKFGEGAMTGTVFKSCVRTGEICPVNARGRDPIVTRIMWLRGLESQNSGAFGRRIYIHGTPDEAHIGRPASFGCIRMRSKDIIALFATVEVGANVEITNNHVGGGMFAKAKRAPLPPTIAAAPAKPAKEKASEAVVAASSADAKSKSSVPVPKSSSAVASATATKAKPSMGTADAEPKPNAAVAMVSDSKTKGKASVAMADSTGSKSKALSLSEPLIGAPDSDSKSASAKKKSVTASGRKSRS